MQGKWGDGQHNARGGRGTTRDKWVADDMRRVMQSNPEVDDTTRRRGWRTCNDAKGGGNGNEEEEEEQSLRWQ
jgi:hypothetical protein